MQIRKWLKIIGLAGLLVGGLSPAAPAASKILVMIGAPATPTEAPQALKEGVLEGMGLQYQAGVTSYPVTSGYTVELLDFDAQANPLIDKTNDPEVVAVVCHNSSECLPATDLRAAQDLLVVSVTGTASTLGTASNILRTAPSSVLQAEAMYKWLKQAGVQRFVTIYETNEYALNLYVAILNEVLQDMLLFGDTYPNELAGMFPIMDFSDTAPAVQSLQSSQVQKLLPLLRSAQLGGLVYLGSERGLKALADPAAGGSPDLAPRWYVGDAVYPLAAMQGFPGLHVFSLYTPDDGRSAYSQYYYGYDAGAFLAKVIGQYIPAGGTPVRAEFLAAARQTELPAQSAKTGAKNFLEADRSGKFNIQIFDAQGVPHIENILVNRQ